MKHSAIGSVGQGNVPVYCILKRSLFFLPSSSTTHPTPIAGSQTSASGSPAIAVCARQQTIMPRDNDRDRQREIHRRKEGVQINGFSNANTMAKEKDGARRRLRESELGRGRGRANAFRAQLKMVFGALGGGGSLYCFS